MKPEIPKRRPFICRTSAAPRWARSKGGMYRKCSCRETCPLDLIHRSVGNVTRK